MLMMLEYVQVGTSAEDGTIDVQEELLVTGTISGVEIIIIIGQVKYIALTLL